MGARNLLVNTIFGGAFVLGSSIASASTQDDLKSLVDAGKSADAYDLAAQHPDLLGTPDFDFYFGLAAIDAGHSAEGVLALERYLLLFPANHQARLELARGYFILGEDARAREEFTAVLALNPPPVVITNIERFLDAIRVRESRYQTSTRGYLEAGIGIDSNINSGVSTGSIALPVLGVVTVANAGQRQGDWVDIFGAGAQVTHPLSPGVAAFAGINWERKQMANKDTFDTESLDGNAGASWLLGNNLLRGTLSYSTLQVDNQRYRDVAGLGGEWQRQLNELESVNAGLQYAEINYTGINEIRDAHLTGAAVGYRRALARDWQPVLWASLSSANEDNQRNRNDLGRMIYTARAGITASPSPHWGLSASFTYQESHYEANDPILGVTRSDRFHSLDMAAVYLLDRHWSISTEASVIENYSNLALYTYSRSSVAVKARYAFK